MWYKPYSSNTSILNFKLEPHLRHEFEDFCMDEVFLNINVQSVKHLLEKIEKNIFYPQKLETPQIHFFSLMLGQLYDKKIPLSLANVEEFIKDQSHINPLHVLVMSNYYSFETIKQTAYFLASINPSSSLGLWKDYFTDMNSALSDPYFKSLQFMTIIDYYIKEFKSFYISNLEAQNKVPTPGNYCLNVAALMKTDTINKKPPAKMDLLYSLMDQKIITPTMFFYKHPRENLLESAMRTPRDDVMPWIKKSLIDFEQDFNFTEMIYYFEKELTPKFYLNNFPPLLKNYKEIINFMKKIAYKNSLELEWADNIKNKKSKGKI